MNSTSLQKLENARALAQKYAAQIEADLQADPQTETEAEEEKSSKPAKPVKSKITRKTFQPKISTYEKAFWRVRLWLNPLLALSALLWFPFALQLFSDNLWFNLAALLVLVSIEYWSTKSSCAPLHTVRAPIWQRFLILYALRRAAVIAVLILGYGALQKTGLPLITLYSSAIGLYWLLQVVLFWQRKKFQRLQMAKLS